MSPWQHPVPADAPERVVRVPDDVWEAAQAAAQEGGLAVDQIVIAALDAFAQAHARRTRGRHTPE